MFSFGTAAMKKAEKNLEEKVSDWNKTYTFMVKKDRPIQSGRMLKTP